MMGDGERANESRGDGKRGGGEEERRGGEEGRRRAGEEGLRYGMP